jgi:hypothetical protein
MKTSSETSRMRVLPGIVLVFALGSIMVFGFQNCAPSLPSDGEGVQASTSLYTQPTPVPAQNFNSSNGSTYATSVWEGSCSSDPAVDAMAAPGLDQIAHLMVFNNSALGTAAIWSFAYSQVYHGVVCKIIEPGWTIRAIGDFNGDGSPDILWRNSDGRNIVWFMNGTSRVSGGFLPTLDASYKLLGTGDFNGDGKADILWGKADGSGLVWKMDGSLTPISVPLSANSAGMTLQGIADFNADGKADLIWRSGNTLTVWFMDISVAGTSVTASTAVTGQTLTSDFQVVGVGDYNGDGRADLLLFNRTTNAAQKVWNMNGAAVVSQTAITGTTNPSMIPIPLSIDISGDAYKDVLFTVPPPSGGGLLLLAWAMGVSGGNTQPLAATYIHAIQPGYTALQYER